jgi:hypothetical protein
MPTWGAVAFGVAATGVLTMLALALVLRERRAHVVASGTLAAMLGPLLWDLVLRHTGGDFFVDAPGYVFPVSFEDAGSGVLALAIGAVVLGLGPMRREPGWRVVIVSGVAALAALLVDTYLY